jgi:hypothetical protein
MKAKSQRKGQDPAEKSDNDGDSDLESIESSPISKLNKFQSKLGKINQPKKTTPASNLVKESELSDLNTLFKKLTG